MPLACNMACNTSRRFVRCGKETPSAIQELVLPLAQRIQGGEYGTVRLVVSTTDPGVKDFVEYMAHVHQLPVYVCQSPLDLGRSIPAGILTHTESRTLDGIFNWVGT